MRKIIVFALSQLLFLAACGGGGGNSTIGGGSGSGSSGGSGGSGSGQTIATVNNTNVVSMEVDTGPQGATGEVNIPYVSITICAPGSTTNCQTIDHVEVDTGSYGVRIISSVLNPTLYSALTPQTGQHGGTLVECTQFGDGYSWGSMRLGDVTIGTEKAAGQSIQIIGDLDSYNNVPTNCANKGPKQEDTVDVFGANGIIGLGPFVTDCGDCTASTESAFYWDCTAGGSGTCQQSLVTTTPEQEATNPVASFAQDFNGVILELPALTASGAATATGALVFGVGTESNNGLGSATVLTTDASGFINTKYNGVTYTQGFIDSGSNENFFDDKTIASCTSGSGANAQTYYCPSSELTLTAIEEGVTSSGGIGNQATVTFYVTDPGKLSGSYAAFDNVASPFSAAETDNTDFDFGLPFFYGRNVFTVIEGKNTSGGTGPYFAF